MDMGKISKVYQNFKICPIKIVLLLGTLLSVHTCDCAVVRPLVVNTSNENELNKSSGMFRNIYCGADAIARNCTENHNYGEKYPLDLTADGYLKFKGDTYISPENFCISRIGNYAKLCSSHVSPTVWRKCCPAHQMLNPFSPKSCIDTPQNISPFRPEVEKVRQSFFVGYSNLSQFSCPDGFQLKKFSRNKCAERSMTSFQLLLDGSLSYEVATGVFLRKNKWKIMKPPSDLYCLDGVIRATTSQCIKRDNSLQHSGSNDKKDALSPPGCDDNDVGQPKSKLTSVLFICLETLKDNDDIQENNISAKTTLLSVIWLLTCPLLFAASIGNSCMIQRNVHGWILTCYLLSMCVLNILSAMVILDVDGGSKLDNESDYIDVNTYDKDVESGGCTPLDFLIKFTYMSTLCWMTSINFDLWKTFSYTLPQPAGLRRFLASALFSLGFPALSTTVCYYVAYAGTDPNCKQEYCLLFSYDTIPFYSLPICILVLGNFAIFLKTSYTIAVLRREAEDVLKRQAQDHLESFTLFVKLFLLTGSIWLLRLVLFVLQVQGMYLSWYGVILEMVFSIPDVVFPMIVFHHPEFIKWTWNRAPGISRVIVKFNPLFNAPSIK